MAQIVLSGDELIGILRANGLVPDQVTEIEVDGEEIRLKVKTPWPLIRSLKVGVHFAAFEDDHLVLQLATNRLIDTFEWLVDKMLESFPLAEYGSRWEYPKLYVNVNRLIREQVQGVCVVDMAFGDGKILITTTHPSWTATPEEETPSNVGEDTSCAPAL